MRFHELSTLLLVPSLVLSWVCLWCAYERKRAMRPKSNTSSLLDSILQRFLFSYFRGYSQRPTIPGKQEREKKEKKEKRLLQAQILIPSLLERATRLQHTMHPGQTSLFISHQLLLNHLGLCLSGGGVGLCRSAPPAAPRRYPPPQREKVRVSNH